jgi:hypothetical protein
MEILARHGVGEADVAATVAVFRAREGRDYESGVEVRIVSADGAEVVRRV